MKCEIYNLKNNPEQTNNPTENPKYRAILAPLHKKLKVLQIITRACWVNKL